MGARLTLLTEEEVSQWLDTPVSTLKDWRQKRINLPFIPMSDRKVRYDQDAVTDYLKSIEVQVENKKPVVAATGQNINN